MKHKLRLEQRILFFRPIQDEDRKEFIPYCNLVYHRGICKNGSYKECERNQCNHYHRLYIPQNTR